MTGLTVASISGQEQYERYIVRDGTLENGHWKRGLDSPPRNQGDESVRRGTYC